ncbi:hypothetical protein ACJ41O_008469 [Fusarium nematophilum]
MATWSLLPSSKALATSSSPSPRGRTQPRPTSTPSGPRLLTPLLTSPRGSTRSRLDLKDLRTTLLRRPSMSSVFSTKSEGFAFYAVTRPVRTPHPNLQGREEDTKSRL